MQPAKALQRVGQRAHRERGHDQDAQLAGAVAAQRLRHAPYRLQLRHHALNLGVQRLGLARGHQPPALPREQRIAQLQLRMLQRLGDGRLGHVQQACGGADRAGQHDGVEDLDVLEAHGGQ